jgi:hypothetical protein
MNELTQRVKTHTIVPFHSEITRHGVTARLQRGGATVDRAAGRQRRLPPARPNLFRSGHRRHHLRRQPVRRARRARAQGEDHSRRQLVGARESRPAAQRAQTSRASAAAYPPLTCRSRARSTDDLPCYHEKDASVRYLRFNVSYWRSCGDSTTFEPRPAAEVVQWLRGSVFSFVDGALAKGEHVLVHCLAGAHRAGTTGVLLLMHKTAMGADEATATAKALRPAIDPICDFPKVRARARTPEPPARARGRARADSRTTATTCGAH